MWQDILQFGVTPVVTAIIAAYGAIKANKYQEKKEKEKQNYLDLHDDITPQIKEICTYLGHTINPIRCDYWIGHNGTRSISGFHMTKLSMLCEWVDEDTPETLHINQDLPTQTFQRNMFSLSVAKEHYIVSRESEHTDQLSSIIRSFGVNTFVAFKTFNSKGQWEGILTLGFEEEDKQLADDEIGYIRIMADRIGSIMSTLDENKK